MPYVGRYINLDRSPERRAEMEAQFALLDPVGRYDRFPAVDGNPYGLTAHGLTDGELGCLMSHYMLLRQNLDSATHLHIIEDDIIMARRAVAFVEQVVSSGMLDDWDILFTETLVPMVVEWCAAGRALYYDMIRRAEDGTAANIEFRLIEYFGVTTSYLVNRRSVRSICEMLRQELDRGARSPIDLLIRTKAREGKLRVRSLFPFITSIRPGEVPSTVREGIKVAKSRLAMELHRYSYFVEADLKVALDLADRRLNNPDEGPQERLHARIAGFASSDSFERY
jgi:GR25 family glycosyltransferase involved in LPS biosynthesis